MSFFNDLKAESAARLVSDLIAQQREQGADDQREPLASLLAAEREISSARTHAHNIVRRRGITRQNVSA